MTQHETIVYDVYLAHATGDSAIVSRVADACRAGGLTTFWLQDGTHGEDASTVMTMREAVRECRALIIILPHGGSTDAMQLDIGAGMVWEKPMYAIAASPALSRPPDYLSDVPFFTIDRIDEVVQAIKLIDRELNDEDRSFLVRLYAEGGETVDGFAADAGRLETLADAFDKGRGKHVSGVRLLSELYRLRRQGKLTGNRPTIRPGRRTHPA